MAQPFVLDVNLRIQKILGLDKVKQQLANIQVGGLGQVNELSKGLQNVGISASNATIQIAKGANATINLGKSAKKTGSQLEGASRQAQSFGDQIFLAGKRYAAFLSATVVAFKAFQAIGAGTKSVIEFDQAMVSLSQIIDKPVDQLQELSQQFLDLSIQTGTSAAEIANAAKLLAQAGFRGGELTEAVIQLAKVPLTPIFENMEQAVDGAIAALRQFSNEGLTVEDVFDKMINVSNKYAASFPDIIEGLKRGGSAFQAIGGTLDDFIAAFTTIRSVTRESASSVGTALKTLSSRLADPKIIQFLETKDIRLIEEGQFVGPIEAIRRIGEGLERTKTIQDRVDIATKLGGRRQISRFLAVAQNAEKTNEILEISRNSFDAFNEVAETGLQAISKQIDIMIAKAKKLAIDLGEELFVPFIKGLTGAAEGAIALLDALKPILPVVAKLGALLVGSVAIKGLTSFLGPRLGQLAGPAAFSAAGGGFRGVGAGIAASPFAQAGLLLAAAEAAAALTRTAEGADFFAGTLITSTAAITAAIALFRNQTIAQFAAGGGLFASLGQFGKLGALGGTLLTAGAIALPIAGVTELQKRQQDLAKTILGNVTKAINEIKIDPIDPKSLEWPGIKEFMNQVQDGLKQSIDRADPFAAGIGIGERISRLFGTGLEVAGNLLEGDFEALFRRGGVTSSEIQQRFKEIIEKSPQFINQIIDNISSAMADAPEEQIPSGRYALTQLARRQGATVEDAQLFAKIIIEVSGGLEEFENAIDRNIDKIKEEAIARENTVKLMSGLVPTKLVSQLLRFSKAIDQTTRTINLSSKLFQSQIAEISGGIRAPELDFDFGTQQVANLVRRGGLNELFAYTPDIPRFVGAVSEIEELLDNFIVNIGNLPTGDIDLVGEVDKFFDFQKDVPPVIRDNFTDFFNTIARDIRNVVDEGQFIDPETIKQRFQKEFSNLGIDTSDAVVESITQFMNATFTQIKDELNRLATVRRFELEAPVRPETQAAFLEQQLRRVGISVGGGRETNLMRGTLEELDLIMRERIAGGKRVGIPGVLPTPRAGFFQGREQRLADIAGDERIRQQVRNSFKNIVLESSELKKKLAELKPGTEGFLSASRRVKELSRSTIELQTTIEALDRATQQALESEKRTLALRQQLEYTQTEARLAEKVRTGAITPIRAERILFDLSKEQERAQISLQDKFDSILEKDNALRVDLAKEISETTKTQAEIISDFDVSTTAFSDATRTYVNTVDLMRKYISDFGQAVVDFKNLGVGGQIIGTEGAAGITPTQIRTGGVTIQQAYDEFNRLMNDTNATREQTLEVLKAIYDRQEQIQPVKQESSAAQKEQLRDAEGDERISQLTESLDKLRVVLGEPNELRIVSDQRVELDLSTLPSDVTDEVRPILEEAGLVIAKSVTRKALESLAAKSDDTEVSIAASNVAQELV